MATPIPQNAAPFTLEEILDATRGALVRAGNLGTRHPLRGVTTDTRAQGGGDVFVALAGETFDAQAHLDAAARSGARLAFVERDAPAPDAMGIVRVPSTLEALGAIARAHARRWRRLGGERRIVGITGSAGKTTTRVAVSALAEALRPGEVLATTGNLNNRIGLPMVLLGLGPAHRLAVIEMGTNRPGEIAELAGIAEPDAGVLTLVAAAHTELLGSLDAVAEEKGALLRALPPDGVALGNADDERVRRVVSAAGTAVCVLYGRAPGTALRIATREAISMTRSLVTLERAGGESLAFETPLLGEAGALACAAAIAVAEHVLGERVDGAFAAAAFARAEVGAGAGRLVPRVFADGLAVIDDTYNANPASTSASIVAASEIAAATGRRLVLVLGEMRELGAEAEPGHDEVGRAAARSGAAFVVAVKGYARRIAERAAELGASATFFDDVPKATSTVLDAALPGDLVLVKGSRGVAMEAIVLALREAHEPPKARASEP